jgi:hypothetical protein
MKVVGWNFNKPQDLGSFPDIEEYENWTWLADPPKCH